MSHRVSDGSPARLIPKLADAHPWLLSATVIMLLGSQNVRWFTLSDVLVVLGQALLAVTLGFLGLLFLRRSARHAALLTSWISLLGCYYGVLFDELGKLPAGGGAALRHVVLLAIGLGVSAVIWHLAGELKPCSKFMSLTAAITLTVFSAKFGMLLAREPRSQWSAVAKTIPTASPVASEHASRPDIYYLILDGYARGDVLQKYYDFDNSEFLNGLQQRGFYVADKSCTNFTATAFSLSSSLNMRYHDSISPEGGYKPLAEMVRDHAVGRCLRECGYKLIHFNTRFMGTSCSDIAHVSLGEPTTWLPAGSRMLALHLIHHSVFRFVNGGDHGIYAAQHRRALGQLAEVPALPGPKFTFCHLIAPHPPFVFTRDGHTDWSIDQDSRQSYIDQLIYLNQEVTRTIDALLAQSTIPPIIIVQSDHGPGFCPSPPGLDPLEDYVQERVPILNAYLVPESMRATLYPTITPVNTFRLLLSQSFGFELPPLPDRNFIIHKVEWPDFSDITDKVHDGTPEPGLRRPTVGSRTSSIANKESTTRVE